MTVASTPHVRRLGILIAAIGVAMILTATLTPQAGRTETPVLCVICGSLGGVDAVLNLILFFPLGVGLGMWKISARTAIAGILLLSLSIETTQYFFITGRDATIGDVITNTLGGAFGFLVASNAREILSPSRRMAVRLGVAWSAVWLVLQVVVSYAILPSLPAGRYYGQIGRVFSDLSPFLGQVLTATIGDVVVPDFGYARTLEFRDRLTRGDFVAAVVVPAGPTPRLAPILRVADDSQREIVLLGQRRQDLAFGVYTGATALRLRPLRFVLPAVFPASGVQWVVAAENPSAAKSDTLQLAARFDGPGVEMRAISSRAIHESRVTVDPRFGWTLILPRQWYVTGSAGELILSLIWCGVILFPLGYCLAFVNAQAATNPTAKGISVVGIVALLITGFAIVPRLLGLPVARPETWLGGVGGLFMGWLIGWSIFVTIRGKSSAGEP